MHINFGYVAMSALLKNCSPSHTITLKTLSGLNSQEARRFRLSALARENLQNTRRLFIHNLAHDIRIFRLTSKLIPLATHPITGDWDWFDELKPELSLLGNFARQHGFRISAHPDHFTLLNSPKSSVTQAAFSDLEYHHQVFAGMGFDSEAKLVLHVGGLYKNKDESIARFAENFNRLPDSIKQRIVLENDDKIYTVRDVLKICQSLKIPMVLDLHHHRCNTGNDQLADYLPQIFATWENEPWPPKIHLSSPKNSKCFRSHADYIVPEPFIAFLASSQKLGKDFDVMIEAKQKDAALMKLVEELKEVRGVSIVNKASIEYENTK